MAKLNFEFPLTIIIFHKVWRKYQKWFENIQFFEKYFIYQNFNFLPLGTLLDTLYIIT